MTRRRARASCCFQTGSTSRGHSMRTRWREKAATRQETAGKSTVYGMTIVSNVNFDHIMINEEPSSLMVPGQHSKDLNI